MTGTNNLNQMATKRFLVIVAVTLVIYSLPELFFENAMLYITGGVIAGTIDEVFEFFWKEIHFHQVLVTWTVLLIGIILLFLRFKNKPLQYFTIVLIAFLLYVVDFILFEVFPDHITSGTASYLVSGIRILSKALILSLIVYFDGKRREEKAAA